MKDIKVRRFERRDTQGVIDLILPIQREEFGIAITADDQPDLAAIDAFYQVGLGDFWVAELDDVIVGAIGLKDIGAGQAALRKMFVAASHRGREFGVAGRLLEGLLRHASNSGLSAIYLGTTDKFIAAHRFYEKNGFTEVSKSALPADFPLMPVDTKFYCLRLPQRA